jgi:hypothetical protein
MSHAGRADKQASGDSAITDCRWMVPEPPQVKMIWPPAAI